MLQPDTDEALGKALKRAYIWMALLFGGLFVYMVATAPDGSIAGMLRAKILGTDQVEAPVDPL